MRAISLAALIILETAFLAVACYYWPVFLEGRVDHLAVVGVRGGTAQTLLVVTGEGLIVKSPAAKRFLGEEVLELGELAEKLKPEYERVYCVVSVELSGGDPLNGLSPGETMGYVTECSNLRGLGAGSPVKLAVTRLNPTAAVWVRGG